MNKKLCKVGMVEGVCGRHIPGHRLWQGLVPKGKLLSEIHQLKRKNLLLNSSYVCQLYIPSILKLQSRGVSKEWKSSSAPTHVVLNLDKTYSGCNRQK